MIFDSLGLPKDNGASDLQDSARLAGLMTVFGYSGIPLEKYVVGSSYVRHPNEAKYDFSRDQAVCLMAGLAVQGRHDLVNRDFITGKDIMSPAVQGHIRRCKGQKANLLQNAWLLLDVLFSALIKPMDESNQLLCILMLADKMYLKLWLKLNRKWKESIREYWCGWRGEPELAEKMIQVLESL